MELKRDWSKYVKERGNVLVLLGGIIVLSVFYFIFGRFLPNENGAMGHDFAYYLPALLDGFLWFNLNGLWEIPWFTPSFCGGWLNYLNMVNGYYTVPQFLTFLTDPVAAVRITLAMFAGVGLLGFYMLLRTCFGFSRPISFLGSVCFLFNGFFAYRMIIGHLCYINFMLVPLAVSFALRPISGATKRDRWLRLLLDCVLSGLLFAIMIESGFASFMIPAIISALVIGLSHGMLFNRKQSCFWIRFAGGGLAGILFSASKLMAMFYLLSNLPRSGYRLPGAESLFHTLCLVVRSLFISPWIDPGRMDALINAEWTLERHEWEYDVTFVPLILILLGLGNMLRRTKAFPLPLKDWKGWAQAGAIMVLLMIPLAVNTYSPDWNAVLKEVPLIRNSSNLIRWFIIYIPFAVLMAALAVEKTIWLKKHQVIVMFLGILLVICLKGLENREFYHSQGYNPDEIVNSYYKVKEGTWKPKIDAIGVYLNKEGQPYKPIYRNDLLIHGMSQLLCYEPLFGYRLECFPVKALHLGSVMEEHEGVLNIKNPACYVWPAANSCSPGDHFRIEENHAAEAFVQYRPYPFHMPITQRIANWVNGFALIAALIFLAAYTFCALRSALISRGTQKRVWV